MAQEELVKTQMKNKKYFDKKARLRVLMNGDKSTGIISNSI